MIESVQFVPVREIRETTPSPDTALISIHDAHESVHHGVPTEGWGYFNHIGVDDAAYNEEQIADLGEDFWTYFDGCARKVHALRFRLMIKEISERPYIKHVIFQCESGRSRSAAVAKYYAETHNLDLEGDLSYANSLIYQLLYAPDYFDEALERYVECKDKSKKPEKPTRSLFPFGWVDALIEKIFGKPTVHED